MSTKNRRLSRLEKLATLTIAERKRREPERAARQHQAALNHAAKLVALILHGNPLHRRVPRHRVGPSSQ